MSESEQGQQAPQWKVANHGYGYQFENEETQEVLPIQDGFLAGLTWSLLGAVADKLNSLQAALDDAHRSYKKEIEVLQAALTAAKQELWEFKRQSPIWINVKDYDAVVAQLAVTEQERDELRDAVRELPTQGAVQARLATRRAERAEAQLKAAEQERNALLGNFPAEGHTPMERAFLAHQKRLQADLAAAERERDERATLVDEARWLVEWCAKNLPSTTYIIEAQGRLARADALPAAPVQADVRKFWHDADEQTQWLAEKWHEDGSNLCSCEDGRHTDFDKIGFIFRDIDREGILALRAALEPAAGTQPECNCPRYTYEGMVWECPKHGAMRHGEPAAGSQR